MQALQNRAAHLHDKLVSARNQRQAVVVVELLRDVLAERVPVQHPNVSNSQVQLLKCVLPSATRRDAPSRAVIGVRPQQVAHRALVRHLLRASSDLLSNAQSRKTPLGRGPAP